VVEGCNREIDFNFWLHQETEYGRCSGLMGRVFSFGLGDPGSKVEHQIAFSPCWIQQARTSIHTSTKSMG